MFCFSIYSYLLIYILCLVVFGGVILMFVFFLNSRFWYVQSSHSIYECGFLPFHESRVQFESKFYMVALSFIIFDLEICFLLPWFLVSHMLSSFCFLFFILFYLLVILGFFYEISLGIFDWE